MTLEAQRIASLGAQQVRVFAAVRLMAGGASLLECRLMQRMLLALLPLIAVARQANINRVGFWQSRLPAGMRVVAVRAVPCGSRMRHLRLIDGLGFLCVTSDAQLFGAGRSQDDLAVLWRGVTRVARLVGKWRMQELPHQLRSG